MSSRTMLGFAFVAIVSFVIGFFARRNFANEGKPTIVIVAEYAEFTLYIKAVRVLRRIRKTLRKS